ncbi:MAG: beta-propeller fold lactonase family protein, partial [Candidatus Eremiobacteraeota bacterium]|nr:beta-propeller fold lactonase family protein [Candidatus Eremiobacteraeota bacterium]
GKFLYVPLFNANQVKAYSVNASTGALTELTSSPVTGFSNPGAAALTPDGASLFISNASAGIATTFSVNTTTGDPTLTGAAGTGANPLRGEVTPDGNFFYVTNFASHTISGYHVLPGSILSELTTSPETASGIGPDSLSIRPDGMFVYSSNGNVYSINTGNGDLTEIASSPFANAVGEPTIDATGNILFAFDIGPGTLKTSLLDPTTGVPTLAASVTTTAGALGTPAVESSNKFVYVSDSINAKVYAFRFDSSGNLTPVPGSPFDSGGGPGTQPTYIIAHPGADFLYIFNRGTDDISIFAINNPPGA